MKLFVLLFSFLLFANPTVAKEEVYPIYKIMELSVDSSINPATHNYISEGFKKAHTSGQDLILLKMNTPGGLLSTTKDILTEIGNSDLPIVIWITPEGAAATSAGAIISSGAHLLLMSNGTSIGAATPIQMSGDIKQSDVRSKAVNSIVGVVKGMAAARGRNIKAFGEMVSEAKTFETKEALKLNLIDGIANNTGDFLKAIDGKEFEIKGKKIITKIHSPRITEFSMDSGQRLLDIFANPSLAYILFLIGAALLYFELQAPGGFLAGSVGVFCLILAGIGFQVLPLNFGAMGLIILSFVLFILEIYIVSYGILTLAGLSSLVAGSLFLFRTDDTYMEISSSLIFSAVSAVGLFVVLMGYFIFKDHQKEKGKHKNNYYSLVSKHGQVVEILESDEPGIHFYQIKVSGEVWNAKSKKLFKMGDSCEVTGENSEEMYLEI